MAADTPPLRLAPLWLAPPDGFTAVDLTEDPGERMARTAAALDTVFADAGPEQRLSLTVATESALQNQLREGAVHLSARLARASDGAPVVGVFTVFVRPENTGPPGSYPQRIADRLAATWPHADVGVLELPPGRAAVAVRDVPVTVPGALYGVPQPAATTVRQVEFLIPHPWSPHVVAAVFTTEQAEYWQEWLPAIAGAISSISFHPPRDETRDDLPPEQWDNIRKAFG
ncbi:hypothetical protein ACIRST_25290 [Kitasatospora sp. NPDC101447]|uniref:hypothetical protein n=1 Tax=Kitasatospora sp. NPDC101447 TaxID=3364102 RepID=UPI0038147DD0